VQTKQETSYYDMLGLRLSSARTPERSAIPAGARENGSLGRAWARFAGNPYLFLGRRPYREARLRSYIVSQHRAGRPLSAILADPYVRRCGSESLCWHVVQDPRTIKALERNVREAIERCSPRL
jgi:hypothetical protein